MYCNVADSYHVTFAFRRVDFYYEIPSIGSQVESPHLNVQGHSYFCNISYFFFFILFHARENYFRNTHAASYCNDFTRRKIRFQKLPLILLKRGYTLILTLFTTIIGFSTIVTVSFYNFHYSITSFGITFYYIYVAKNIHIVVYY